MDTRLCLSTSSISRQGKGFRVGRLGWETQTPNPKPKPKPRLAAWHEDRGRATKAAEETPPCWSSVSSGGRSLLCAVPVPSRAFPVPSRAFPVPSRAFPVPSRAVPVPLRAFPVPSRAFPVPSCAFPVPSRVVPVRHSTHQRASSSCRVVSGLQDVDKSAGTPSACARGSGGRQSPTGAWVLPRSHTPHLRRPMPPAPHTTSTPDT
eukprot:351538-Chlamydomonas_euryale.AAC.6